MTYSCGAFGSDYQSACPLLLPERDQRGAPRYSRDVRALPWILAAGLTSVTCGRLGYDFEAPAEGDPLCEFVDCSGNGVCNVVDGLATCACDDGFVSPAPSSCEFEECLDNDDDGFMDKSCGGTDCDDQNREIHPNAEGPVGSASCVDAVDNDCDEATDSDDPDCTEATFEAVGALVQPVVDLARPNYITIGNRLFFAGNTSLQGDELWVTDGTDEGTQQLTNINPLSDSAPSYFHDLGGTLLFFANDGANGIELWRSDGTQAGTRLVHDINPAGDAVSFPQPVVLGDYLLFEATDGESGRELWRSDGTSAGTELVLDINPGAEGSNPYEIQKISESLAVLGAQTAEEGIELWVTDGTTANTLLIADSNPGTENSLPPGWFRYFATHDGYAYYRGTEGANGFELWRTNGTAAGTHMVRDLQPGEADGVANSPNLAAAGTKVFYQANDGSTGLEVFSSDGTETNTELLLDINPSGDSLPAGASYSFTSYADVVYFRASNGVDDIELWRTDGTGAGTAMVKNISPSAASTPAGFFIFKNQLFFAASDDTRGRELWQTDGTASGTKLAVDINLFGDGDPLYLGEVNGIAIFSATNVTGLPRLWRGL